MDGSVTAAASQAQLRYRSPAGRWVIAASVLGSGVAALDATVVGIALPTMGRDLHTGLGPLQWVVNGYTLTLAAFLLLGGSLGDRLGRRRIFAIGIIWFAVASVACGIAPTVGVLIAMRVLQGVGAALATPGSLAILEASFASDDRSQAIGAWSGLGGITTAIGPLVGGYLISVGTWRWVFFLNIPVSALVVLITVRHVPESRDPYAAGRVDVPGALLAVVALAGVTFALIQAPTDGWSSPAVVTMLLAGIGATIAFVVVEHRKAHPMLPLGIFRSRQFTAANAVTFVMYAALGGVLFLLPTELQVGSGYSALQSGLAMLPVPAVMLALSAQSGKLAGRIGPRLQMSVGPLVVGAGMVLLTRATSGAGYLADVLPAVAVFGLGLAITVAPLTSTAMAAAPSEHAGMASAVNNDVARVGGLVAVAVLPALAGITGDTYLHAHQLDAGFRTAVLIGAAACGVAGLLAVVGIRNPPVAERAAAAPAAGAPAALVTAAPARLSVAAAGRAPRGPAGGVAAGVEATVARLRCGLDAPTLQPGAAPARRHHG